MLKRTIKWLFPDKLNFGKEFLLNPISEDAKKAFTSLTSQQVRDYFNYEEPSLLGKFLDDGVNRHSYEDKLNSVIDRLERGYIRSGESDISHYFDYVGDDSLISKGYGSFLRWSTLCRTVLINLEPICAHLNRQPIPELLEDISTQNLKGNQKRDQLNEEKSKLVREKYLDYENKNDFLKNLINELEMKKVDRREIIKILQEKFLEEFSVKVQHIVRINGIWTIKFDDKTVNISPLIET